MVPDHPFRVVPVGCWIFWFVALGSPGASLTLLLNFLISRLVLAGDPSSAEFLPSFALSNVFLHVGSSFSLLFVLEKHCIRDPSAGPSVFVILQGSTTKPTCLLMTQWTSG